MPVSKSIQDRMVRVRRDLHMHPELSFEEERTARVIAEELSSMGLSVKSGVGGHGLVVDIEGRQDGPRVALRADMDALPIREETGLPFASVHDGVMHACGHDGHSAMLVGAAELLRDEPPPGPVRLLWQPAEETGRGAVSMIEAGAVADVAMIFGAHVDRRYDPGVLVVTDGVVNASADTFRIEVVGRQGHGARPHQSIDAVLVGAHLVTALQSIVAREIDPAMPAVVSVGSFHAGSASNVIAGRASLEGTLRAQDPTVRSQLHSAVRRIGDGVAAQFRAEVDVQVILGSPPVINDVPAASLARVAAEAVAGPGGVTTLERANMGGEDFSWYLGEIPGCYIRLGSKAQGCEHYPAHSSRFDIDESSLGWGARWYSEVARRAGVALRQRSA